MESNYLMMRLLEGYITVFIFFPSIQTIVAVFNFIYLEYHSVQFFFLNDNIDKN